MRGNWLRIKHYLIRNWSTRTRGSQSHHHRLPPSLACLLPYRYVYHRAHVLTANDACHVWYVSHDGNSSNIRYSTSKDGIHSGGRSCFRSRCCR